jgi:membrane protease YdiL (CAAX protease family)
MRAPEPPGLLPDLVLFLGGGCVVAALVGWGVPALSAGGVEPLAAWMLLAIPLLFAPLLACGALILRSEGRPGSWRERLRLGSPSAADWRWGMLALLGVAGGSAVAFRLCQVLGLDPNPPFARGVQPLVGGRLWMLALWAVYWPVNILAEEIVWRGISLPRMQARLGAGAWPLNAALWGAFHAGFGPGNLLVLVPSLCLVPWIAQRRSNTWLAVLLHAGLSGPGFVALALGLVRGAPGP